MQGKTKASEMKEKEVENEESSFREKSAIVGGGGRPREWIPPRQWDLGRMLK